MSILLESLNRSKRDKDDASNPGIPNISDSHFDDEMLSDDWLFSKLKFWKRVSLFQTFLLLVSWGLLGYMLNSTNTGLAFTSDSGIANSDVSNTDRSNTDRSNADLSNSSGRVETKESVNKGSIDRSSTQVNTSQNESMNSSRHEEKPSSTDTSSTDKKVAENDSIKRETYQPRKIPKTVTKSTTTPVKTEVSDSESLANIKKALNNQNGSGKKSTKKTKASSTVASGKLTNYNSLTAAEKAELPELNISSHVVSDNPKKSFIVLNGSFYGAGETITNGLILEIVDKDGIILKFNGRRIRKKVEFED